MSSSILSTSPSSVMQQQIRVSSKGWQMLRSRNHFLTLKSADSMPLSGSSFCDVVAIRVSYPKYSKDGRTALSTSWPSSGSGLWSGKHHVWMQGNAALTNLAVKEREGFNPLSAMSNKWDNSPADYQLFYLQCRGLFNSYYDWLKNIMEHWFFSTL